MNTIDITQNAWVMTTLTSTGRERMEHFTPQFTASHVSVPLEFICFHSESLQQALNFRPGVYLYKYNVVGLMLARYGIISMARSLRLPYIVTYEDDVKLCENFFSRVQELVDSLINANVQFDSLRLGWRDDAHIRNMLPPMQIVPSVRTALPLGYYDVSGRPYHLPGNFINVTRASAFDKILHTFYERDILLSQTLCDEQVCAPGGTDNWLAHPSNGITIASALSYAIHSDKTSL